jgi:hypothetical protein
METTVKCNLVSGGRPNIGINCVELTKLERDGKIGQNTEIWDKGVWDAWGLATERIFCEYECEYYMLQPRETWVVFPGKKCHLL